MYLTKLIVTVLLILMTSISMVFAGNLPNGAECAQKKSNLTGDKYNLKDHLKCKSNKCMPGPSKRGRVTKWYCTSASAHCAFPGESGSSYTVYRRYNGSGWKCVKDNGTGWAHFEPHN